MKVNVNSIENELLDIVYSYRKAQLLYVAAKLNISDLLADGTKNSDEIARHTDTDSDTIYRVMRALSSFGIYKENQNKYFEITEKGELLKKDNPSSVRIDIIMRMDEYNWKPWGELLYSVKTGENAFENIFGMNLFEYLTKNPEASQTFSKAMGIYTQNNAKAVLDNYDFSSNNMIADIGGSNGDLLRQLLLKYTHISGLLFDLPIVIQNIDTNIFEPNISSRLKVLSGNFFESIPQNYDLYIFKKILHDWDDEHSIKILTNCYNAARKGAKILITENVIDTQNKNSFNTIINDIHMLVQTIGGRERTQDEYYGLLKTAGFEPTKGCLNYVEGIKR
jgi:predicted transcriptional regulator